MKMNSQTLWALGVLLLVSGSSYAQVHSERDKKAELKKTEMSIGELVPKNNILESAIDPEKYLVGPGDQFMISIWGQVNESFVSAISPEGAIIIPSVKEIDVRELSLSQAKNKIAQEMSKIYVNAAISVNLLALRSFRVNLTGIIDSKGSVEVTAVDRVSNAIVEAGGILDTLLSSQRNIQVRRKNGSILRADLVKRNNTGDIESDPTLSNGDLIYIPPIFARIYVYGAVKIPLKYEYVAGERISDIITLCGGLQYGVDSSQVQLVRFKNDTGRVTMDYNLELPDILNHPDDSTINMRILPDDRLFFKKKPQFHPRSNVTIIGDVMRPGVYPIIEGQVTVSDIISEAGGFTPHASIERMLIYRNKGSEGSDEVYNRLKLTLLADMNEIEKSYFKAKSRQEFPTVQTDFAKLFDNGKVNKKYDVLLKPDDLIFVPTFKKTITVVGGVAYSGILDWIPGENYKYYIEKAGGFNAVARKSKIIIIKSLGRQWKDADEKVTINDGDVIFVPEKEPIDGWKIFRDTLATVGQLAAIVSTVFVIVFYIKQTKK